HGLGPAPGPTRGQPGPAPAGAPARARPGRTAGRAAVRAAAGPRPAAGELLDDEPAERHRLLPDVRGRVRAGGVRALPRRLWATRVAVGGVRHARDERPGGLRPRRRGGAGDQTLGPPRRPRVAGGTRVRAVLRQRVPPCALAAEAGAPAAPVAGARASQ